MAFVLLANPTGGLLQNDEQRISIAVGPGAKAHATTQSATKVYSMPRGSASQWLDLTVADGGYLEYLPDPVIPFRLANLTQSTNLTVSSRGVVIFQEVITPGRVAMGEAFDYTRLAYRLALARPDGHPIYREAFELTPATVRQMGLGVLGAATDPDLSPPLQTLGSMLIVADPSSAQSILTDLRPTLAGRPGRYQYVTGQPRPGYQGVGRGHQPGAGRVGRRLVGRPQNNPGHRNPILTEILARREYIIPGAR
jgi:urease accessory protein